MSSWGKNELNGRVFLLGYADEEQKEKLYAIADLYIQPNIQVAGDIEGFGLVDAGGRSELYLGHRCQVGRPTRCGNRVECDCRGGNEDEYVRQINKYLMDDALRNNLCKKGQNVFGEQFEWHRISKPYFDIMTSTLD